MTVRWSTLATAFWLGVHLTLLVALGLSFVWPLVDPQAIERDPSHTHLVLGGDEVARSHALAAHLHAGLAFDRFASTNPVEVAPDQDGARVIVVGSHEGAEGGALGQAAKTLLPPILVTLVCLSLVANTIPWRNPLYRSPLLRRLDPPPRCLPA